MQFIQSLTFRADNKKNDFINQVILTCIALGVFGSVLFRNLVSFSFLGGSIIIGLVRMSISDGVLNFFYDHQGKFFLKNEPLTTNHFLGINNYEFSWNYIHMGIGGRDDVVNHIQLKLELTLENQTKIVLMQELWPWQGIPKHWSYKLPVNANEYNIIYIRAGLKNLKIAFEKLKT